MKIFFLGGTSYLGKEIIKRLQSRKDFDIYAYVRNAESVAKLSGLNVKQISVLAEAPVFDLVFNLVVDYGKGKELTEVMDTNVTFPLSILEKIKFNSIINFSSSLTGDVSHYAFSKKMLEEKLEKMGDEDRFQVINLHLQHFYGPGAPAHNFVTFLVTKMMANEELPLTDCEQRRDFIYTDDVLDAVEVLLRNIKTFGASEVIEIGSGESVRLKDFVNAIKKVSSSSSKLVFGAVSRRPNEPVELVANIDKMKKLGWKPKTSLQEGISQTIVFHKRTQI